MLVQLHSGMCRWVQLETCVYSTCEFGWFREGGWKWKPVCTCTPETNYMHMNEALFNTEQRGLSRAGGIEFG